MGMHRMTIERLLAIAGGQVGVLSVDGKRVAYSLETPFQLGSSGASFAPAGTYRAQTQILKPEGVKILVDGVKGNPGMNIFLGANARPAAGNVVLGTSVGLTSVANAAAASRAVREAMKGIGASDTIQVEIRGEPTSKR